MQILPKAVPSIRRGGVNPAPSLGFYMIKRGFSLSFFLSIYHSRNKYGAALWADFAILKSGFKNSLTLSEEVIVTRKKICAANSLQKL